MEQIYIFRDVLTQDYYISDDEDKLKIKRAEVNKPPLEPAISKIKNIPDFWNWYDKICLHSPYNIIQI